MQQLLRRVNCWLNGGHEYIRRISTMVFFLECMRCGHQTPGWSLKGRIK